MKKILLLEDDLSLGKNLSERLSQEYSVVWCSNYQNALKELNTKNHYDLFILDIGLPDGNGFDFAKDILKQSFYKGSFFKIILVIFTLTACILFNSYF